MAGSRCEVLSRELRENSKKSFELSLAIVPSSYAWQLLVIGAKGCHQYASWKMTCACAVESMLRCACRFHPILMQHQCGDATLRVVEYESKRHMVSTCACR
eukprot:6246668-Amphidinium_carterae.1